MIQTVRAKLWSAADLDAAATLVSGPIDVRYFESVALLLKATHSSGTPSLKAEYAVGHDGEDFGDFSALTEIEDDTANIGGSATPDPENWHSFAFDPGGACFIKIRLTELAALNNNVVDAFLLGSERLQ